MLVGKATVKGELQSTIDPWRGSGVKNGEIEGLEGARRTRCSSI